MSNELKITESPITGLFVVQLPVHGDSRGWFKENWQNEKFTALGFPEFKPVQNNISFNEKVGTTRGIHAEPWDKFISVANGKIFGAWVDLREGESFGKTFTVEVDPSIAVFVPRGVGNAYQTLEPNTSYTYLVNDHWSPTAKYTFLNLADETANIEWPISLQDVEISEKDENHPRLAQVIPFKAKKIVILGANGQLGKALQLEFPEAIALSRTEFDLTDTSTWNTLDWNDVSTVINAAAYTKVDEAETIPGRQIAWAVNAIGVGNLAAKCESYGITLVHISSDYVFDGTKTEPYTEEDPFSPLGVYGQTKAAGDLLVGKLKKHYIIRTSWLIGGDDNFIAKIAELARTGKTITVVNDQIGRLTSNETLAAGIKHLMVSHSQFGTYNLSSSGAFKSWYEISQNVFEFQNRDTSFIEPITSDMYFDFKNKKGEVSAFRPKSSKLNISKLIATGFSPPDVMEILGEVEI